jgi:hypothetical protein
MQGQEALDNSNKQRPKARNRGKRQEAVTEWQEQETGYKSKRE